MTKRLKLAIATALTLTAGSAYADGPDFTIMDRSCQTDQTLPCTTTASLMTRENTIVEVADKLSRVMPVQVTVERLIEMNNWSGAGPDTVIPEGVHFQVM